MDRTASPLPSVPPNCAQEARREDLVFLSAMLVELCSIARRQHLDMLAYLIEMARFEAADQIKTGQTKSILSGFARQTGPEISDHADS